MPSMRTALNREVVDALISTKAIDFDRIGGVLSKFGARAALDGDPIGIIVNWRVIDICIPVDFYDLVRGVNLERTIGERTIGGQQQMG